MFRICVLTRASFKPIIFVYLTFHQAVRALLHSDVPSTLQALLNPDFGVLLKALVHRLLAETAAYHSIRFEPESHCDQRQHHGILSKR